MKKYINVITTEQKNKSEFISIKSFAIGDKFLIITYGDDSVCYYSFVHLISFTVEEK